MFNSITDSIVPPTVCRRICEVCARGAPVVNPGELARQLLLCVFSFSLDSSTTRLMTASWTPLRPRDTCLTLLRLVECPRNQYLCRNVTHTCTTCSHTERPDLHERGPFTITHAQSASSVCSTQPFTKQNMESEMAMNLCIH